MEDKSIKDLLEYRESLYEQLTVINGILGDETYTRRSKSSYYEDKYGIDRKFYIFCDVKPLIHTCTTCIGDVVVRV